MAEPQDNSDKRAVKETIETFEQLTTPIKAAADALNILVKESESLNKNFGLARSRIVEMQKAIADSARGVISLGGKISDATATIEKIAAGSRRNLIANEETVAQLYAANKVLNIDAQTLVEKFGSVGYEASQIGENLQESITKVQGLGLNASIIMKDVANNMEVMNRFQFEGGVQGLTKMAAQASMLRFDMKQTFDLANRVLNPEGAIEIASAFQRLGVSVGNLADPFALMNQSITDPSGLQNSLAEVAKTFTYFDEETKSFKINPQGVLTLKALEDQTHVSATEMSKMGLAAAELDRRLSDVSLAGLKFENEDDKQYLANIAKMGKGGKYEVELKDGTKKELQNLNQEEFDELIEQQKNAPKTMEDIAKSQLNVMEEVAYNTKATLDALLYGTMSNQPTLTNLEGVGNVSRNISREYSRNTADYTENAREKTTDIMKDVAKLFEEKESGKISSKKFEESLEKFVKKIEDEGTGTGKRMLDDVIKSVVQGTQKSKGGSAVERKLQDTFKMYSGNKTLTEMIGNADQNPTSNNPVKGSLLTRQTNMTNPPTSRTQMTRQMSSQVDFGGTITIKVDAPPGVSEQQFKTYFESEEFKKKIYEYYNQKAKELEKP